MGLVVRYIQLEELIERYGAGERDFTGFEVRDKRVDDYWKLEDVDLSGIILKGGSLYYISGFLQGINLSGSDLRKLDLSRADFQQANLSGANLSRTCLWRARFSYANLRGTNLSRTDLQETEFFKAEMRGVNLSQAKILDTSFGGANLMGANFTKLRKCQGFSIRETNLNGADFSDTDLSRANVAIDELRGSYFKNTIMPNGTIGNTEKWNCHCPYFI